MSYYLQNIPVSTDWIHHLRFSLWEPKAHVYSSAIYHMKGSIYFVKVLGVIIAEIMFV